MPRFSIHHVTKYTYEGPVRDSANRIVLFPVKDEHQDVYRQELQISGDPPVDVYKDYYGNEIGSFTHAEPHTSLIIDSRIEVITRPREEPSDQADEETQWRLLREIGAEWPYLDFLLQEPFAALEEVTESVHWPQAGAVTPLTAARQLCRYVYDHFSYIKGVTSVETTLDEIWKLKAGVCQDFAHMLLVLLRQIRIPARYVSGYICPNRNGMRGEGATHAWIEAYIPYYGWLGLDPTNNCLAGDKYVRLAVGRNFSDCSPVKGVYKGAAGQVLEVGVSVSYEDGKTVEEEASAALMPQPAANGTGGNSFRRHMEMMQQQ